MKKIHKFLLTAVLIVGTLFVCIPLHEEHVHALNPGDLIGRCPSCGQNTYYLLDYITPPTCESPGAGFAQCRNCYNGNSNYYIPPLGHNYRSSVTKQATCTQTGVRKYECTRCHDSYTKTIAALGHNYKATVTLEATCTQEGERKYTCTRCNDSYNEVISALGHDYAEERVEPDCTNEGYVKQICNRCDDEQLQVLEALGHDWGVYSTIQQATCEEDGLMEASCNRCDAKDSQIVPKLGHLYPEDWTVEKEPTIISKGLRYKKCQRCGNRIEEEIPAKIKPSILIGGGTATVGIATAVFLMLKKSAAAKAAEAAAKSIFKPSFENKALVIQTEREKLIEYLKNKHYLKVRSSDAETLKDSVADNEPDLVIADALTQERLDEIIELKKENFPETPLGLIVSNEVRKDNRDQLDELCKDGFLTGYSSVNDSDETVTVELLLPVLKPDIKSDATLENIGKIADTLGITGISTVIDVYLSGREIKETLEAGELGYVDTATIIGDIASILGFDTVSSIAGLVDDVDTIKTALDKEKGTYEKKKGVKAAMDVSDVISDIIDK